jgi:hypothetical protein
LAIEHVLDVYVVRDPAEADQFVFISSLNCWYEWCIVVIHALTPFVYGAGEEVWNVALHGDVDRQGQHCGGAGFHEYGIEGRGVFEGFRGPFVNFLEGVLVGYGSEEYNELFPRVV